MLLVPAGEKEQPSCPPWPEPSGGRAGPGKAQKRAQGGLPLCSWLASSLAYCLRSVLILGVNWPKNKYGPTKAISREMSSLLVIKSQR